MDVDNLQIQITSDASGASKSLNSLVKKLEKLAGALNAVDATKVNVISAGFNAIGVSGVATAKGIDKASKSARNAVSNFNSLASSLGKFYATYALLTKGGKSIWRNIESSMDYVETSNYFSVALGQIGQQFEKAGYESAELYTEALTSELNDLNRKLTGYTLGESGEAIFGGNVGLGMDIEQIMNFQAKTLAVTNSVGLMDDASIETAKAVSMLAGDLSSLTNVDVESVMTNLSSGLIGQSRALYKYGIDITQNTLQQYALAEGIEKSVAEMTQAEKMQLRLLAILDQSTVAQTDLANTINSVANQYRVADQQIGNLGRTIGNLFLPIVQNVLPYVNGLIIALNKHNSYRENGKVKKKQYVIATARYYDIATGFFSLYDYGNSAIERVAVELNVSEESIYDLIGNKLDPLKTKIKAEFAETEEFKTHEEHEKITTLHAAKKVEFAHKYGVDASEYDKIYDVFGNLKNAEYLEQIKERSKFRKEYEEKSRSYYKQNQSNYNYEDYFGGYSKSNSNNYTEENKDVLKQFYRVLSKKFHPDANPDTDTSKEMQLLNQLKEQWGV